MGGIRRGARLSPAGIISTWEVLGTASPDALLRAWSNRKLSPRLLPDPFVVNYEALQDTVTSLAKRTPNIVAGNTGLHTWVVMLAERREGIGAGTEFHLLLRTGFLNAMTIQKSQPETDKDLHTAVHSRLDAEKTALAKNLASLIQAEYEGRRRRATVRGFAGAVVKMAILSSHAVAISDGAYFVPEAYASTWRQIAADLQRTGCCEFQEIPVERTPSGDAAICEAVRRQVGRTLDELEVELRRDPTENPDISTTSDKDSKAARILRLAEVEEQLGVYEKLFNSESVVQDALVDLRAKLSAALLVIEGNNVT